MYEIFVFLLKSLSFVFLLACVLVALAGYAKALNEGNKWWH